MMDVAVTLPALVWGKIGQDEDREALAWKSPSGWIKTSRGAFKAMVREIVLGLHDLGIRAGDKVAIHSENRTEWLAADLAIVSLGGASVPIYTTQPRDQIRYIPITPKPRRCFSRDPTWRRPLARPHARSISTSSPSTVCPA